MELGFETIGNATLICHDKKPILVTDPWVKGYAYFGSWAPSHQIPEQQMNAILASEYVWISHGHPDHLSMSSLKLLKDKKILLPDHVGSRIHDYLKETGYNVFKLKDREWTQLSENVRVLSIADYFQDAVILIDVGGKLIVNTNDAGETGWGPFVRKQIKKYDTSFLLQLTGFGDTDLINYFDEGSGERIMPVAAKRVPFGKNIALVAEGYGVKYLLPFSSMHQYHREDSIWANQCVTKLTDYAVGFESDSVKILPAYIQWDCIKDTYETTNPPENISPVVAPEEFGDSWTEPLEDGDFDRIKEYFKAIFHLDKVLGFINFKVAGKTHRIEFNSKKFDRGITFETPRGSLMKAVKHQIFDDLLVGNFMKCTLHGPWHTNTVYPHFTPYVTKYADNGNARSEQEIASYFKEYRRRAFFDYIRHKIEEGSTDFLRPIFPRDSGIYHIGRTLYHKYKRLTR